MQEPNDRPTAHCTFIFAYLQCCDQNIKCVYIYIYIYIYYFGNLNSRLFALTVTFPRAAPERGPDAARRRGGGVPYPAVSQRGAQAASCHRRHPGPAVPATRDTPELHPGPLRHRHRHHRLLPWTPCCHPTRLPTNLKLIVMIHSVVLKVSDMYIHSMHYILYLCV